MSNISIIIPVLNEAKIISKFLEDLYSYSSSKNILEIIIVDGESSDATIQKAKVKNSIILTTKKGRARQMNFGAQYARGDILYFVHADSIPPKHFDQLIINAVNNGSETGCFKMKFNSSHWWLKVSGWFTQFNWKICRGGDQSLFITKSLFNELNGFNEEFLIYEDIEFINRLYKKTRFKIIQKWLTTSARRYRKNGVWKLQYHFFIIYLKRWTGSSPKSLQKYYLKYIK